MKAMVPAHSGRAYPRLVEYPVINLVRDKLLNVIELDALNPKLFPERTPATKAG